MGKAHRLLEAQDAAVALWRDPNRGLEALNETLVAETGGTGEGPDSSDIRVSLQSLNGMGNGAVGIGCASDPLSD